MHITSLPSPYGIGTLGREAYRFADFLRRAAQTYWQILPIGPTGFADSPYQSFSTFAGNPYLIDLDILRDEGLLHSAEYMYNDWGNDEEAADYGKIYAERGKVLAAAADRLFKLSPEGFRAFCRKNASWLDNYALFMAAKEAHGGAPWTDWESGLRRRDEIETGRFEKEHSRLIDRQKAVQFLFFRQWEALRRHTEKRGIQIIGDMPIYVAQDSADVWANPELFLLDSGGRPAWAAGVPPDGFSDAGQLWGNPVYNWDAMRKNGYEWWISRMRAAAGLFDIVRIDHMRGFESYYAIPADAADAREGHWEKGPGIGLFRAIEKELGPQRIIAEDLGFITEDVKTFMRATGYPGMKILEFAFDSRDDSAYLPHNYERNCAVYTGTHDNDTALGWLAGARPEDAALAKRYLRLHSGERANWGMMRAVWASVADAAIVQMQDILGLGSEARMNTPSTTGRNWKWRARRGVFTDALAEMLRAEMELYGRSPKQRRGI